MTENNKINSDCYVFLLSKAYQKGHQMVQKRLEPLGLTNIQYMVLEVLWHKEGLTAGELGKRLNIDKATLSGILDRMSDSDWINKKRDEGDRRMFRLFPSGKSMEMKDRLKKEREDANEELLSGFTSEERVLLRRLLLGLL